MDLEIETIEDLYHRLRPALRTKRRSLRAQDKIEMTEEEIWNYLRRSKWNQSKDLSLAEMVDDILNTKINPPTGDNLK